MPGRRLLAVAYLVPVTAAVGALVLLGFLIERLPLVPMSVRRGYERGLFGAVAWLAAPVDGLAASPEDRDPAVPPGARSRTGRHN